MYLLSCQHNNNDDDLPLFLHDTLICLHQSTSACKANKDGGESSLKNSAGSQSGARSIINVIDADEVQYFQRWGLLKAGFAVCGGIQEEGDCVIVPTTVWHFGHAEVDFLIILLLIIIIECNLPLLLF